MSGDHRAFTVRLPEEVYEDLRRWAWASGVTMARMVTDALSAHFAHLEEEQRLDAILAETAAKFRRLREQSD